MKKIFKCIVCNKIFVAYCTKQKPRVTCSKKCKIEYMRRIQGGFDKVSKRLLRKIIKQIS